MTKHIIENPVNWSGKTASYHHKWNDTPNPPGEPWTEEELKSFENLDKAVPWEDEDDDHSLYK